MGNSSFNRIPVNTAQLTELDAQVQASIGKNLIINGAMDIAQRGTSFAAIADSGRSLDMYLHAKGGTMVHTVAQDTDVPTLAQAGCKFNYSMKIDCTTADTDIASGDYCMFRQAIEGYNIRNIMGKVITLSFWVKATKIGIYSCVLRGSDRCYAAEYTVNVTNTWEKKTITLTMHDGSSGTWNYTNGTGLLVYWTLAMGSTYAIAPNVWTSGSYYGSVNQVNACDSTDNNFWLTGVQLELGSQATNFELRDIQREIALCQRYYEKSYSLTTAPGTATWVGGSTLCTGVDTTGSLGMSVCFKVTKRDIPTVVAYDYAGTADKVQVDGVDGKTAHYGSGKNQSQVYIYCAGLGGGKQVDFQWVVYSEL